jgi:hypothetical protein
MGVLWLVCDVSGSMLEAGKRFIVSGLVREIEQFVRLGYGGDRDVELITWNDVVTRVEWSVEDEVPTALLECHSSSDATALITFLEEEVGEDDRVAVMTDGFWDEESRNAIDRSRGRGGLRIFKIGADANPRLTGVEVFQVEDFFAAVDGWLDG